MKRKRPFDARLMNIPSSLWSLITKIDEYKGRWTAGAKLSPQVLGRLKRSVLVTSTGASTRIEGVEMSDEDIEKLMRGVGIEKFRDRDKQEVQGYYELLNNVFNSWERIRFSESTIKHFHKELLKYVTKDELHRGDYKKQENKVHMIDNEGRSIAILFDTTPAYLTPKEMQELVEWTNAALDKTTYHSLLIIGNFIVEFLNIHPFQDGNGRISRVLTNLLLLHAGYLFMPYISHEKLIEDNKVDYYLALRKSQKTIKKQKENILPWVEFFLRTLLQQSEMALGLLSKAAFEKLFSRKQLAVWEYLKKVKEASPQELSQKTNVRRPTINQIMDKFLQLKIVERIGLGRSTRYRVLS